MAGPMAVGGLVGARPGDSEIRFLGTCFALRRPDYFVTAKHVVTPEPTVLKVGMAAETETGVLDVAEVFRHERADLAVVRTEGARRYFEREGRVSRQAVPRAQRERAFFVDDVARDELLTGVWYES